MRKLFGLLIIGALLSMGQKASADSLSDGIAAFSRGDYSGALRSWRPLAERGDAFLQVTIGSMYENGNGVLQDYKEAVRWYRLAADQGDASGQSSLAWMYAKGVGVPQDHKQALQWFRLAAVQGNASAQESLGVMYYNGYGVARDDVRAHMWFNLAAASTGALGSKSAAENRNKTASILTPAQIERAQEMARKCEQSKFKDCGW